MLLTPIGHSSIKNLPGFYHSLFPLLGPLGPRSFRQGPSNPVLGVVRVEEGSGCQTLKARGIKKLIPLFGDLRGIVERMLANNCL